MQTADLQKTYEKIFDVIDQAENIMLAMHRKPDGDTAGACLAVSHYLDSIGKKHVCFCVDALSESLSFLPGKEKITTDPLHWNAENATYDLIIVFDSGDLYYNGIGKYVEKLQHDFVIVNIDHHATNTHYGDYNLVIDTASSTCEIVHDFLQSKSILTKEMSTCLMTGVVTDTGGFTNMATTASSMQTASKLLQRGANLSDIAQKTMQHRSLSALKLWGRALERLRMNQYGMIVTVITQQDMKECGSEYGVVEGEGLANFLHSLEETIENQVVLVLIEQTNGTIKGSLRTKNSLIDVSKFATLLGGGGHKKAAGFTISGKLQKDGEKWIII